MKAATVKRFLIGKPFPTSRDIHERLDKVRALAVFASDPISSNAYATEAIMSVLIVLGNRALGLTLPIALSVAALVILVIFSYIQTILHYPTGGGAYIVAKDNLGVLPALMAGAALLTDYVLTVSVSVSAGVRAVTSAFPETFDFRVWMALAAILVITWINLRGVRESGTILAFPTYAFVFGVLLVVAIGLIRSAGLFGAEPLHPIDEVVPAEQTLTGFAFVWLVLRAFAGGCTALTGIEAISDGVQAFKPPESVNAAKTMVAMGVMAMSLFIGITYLATHLHLIPHEGESILSQMTREVTGGGVLYYWVQVFTALILFLAANTGFQDFPRLSSFLARDGFLPRWLRNRGDRLVFSYGIIVLAFVSAVMVIIFQADEIAMLPLYALGVMLGFTLSQAGMFRLMGKIGRLKPGESAQTSVTTIHYESGWRWKRVVNATGAIVTAIVFVILVGTKFIEGAWIIVLAIPVLVYMFHAVHRHYEHVSASLSTRNLKPADLATVANVAIVPIADVHRGTLRALQYAKRISDDVRAVCVITSPETRERVERRWNRFPELTQDVKLILIDYDYRDILTPLADYIEQVNRDEFPHQLTTVVIPEFIPEVAVAGLLHNQTANILRSRLRRFEDIVVIDVPYHILGEDDRQEPQQTSKDGVQPPVTAPESMVEPGQTQPESNNVAGDNE
jgi:amino acid transporter